MGENEKVRKVDVVAHKITFDATRLLAEYWVEHVDECPKALREAIGLLGDVLKDWKE